MKLKKLLFNRMLH